MHSVHIYHNSDFKGFSPCEFTKGCYRFGSVVRGLRVVVSAPQSKWNLVSCTLVIARLSSHTDKIPFYGIAFELMKV